MTWKFPRAGTVLGGLLWLVLLLAALGCVPTEPLPSGAQPLTPPPVYREWYAATEACSGLTGSFASIRWYVMPGVEQWESAKGPVVGLWQGRQEGAVHYITLAESLVNHELVVRHEMLHSLLNATGHPVEYFETRCGLTWETFAPSQLGD